MGGPGWVGLGGWAWVGGPGWGGPGWVGLGGWAWVGGPGWVGEPERAAYSMYVNSTLHNLLVSGAPSGPLLVHNSDAHQKHVQEGCTI